LLLGPGALLRSGDGGLSSGERQFDGLEDMERYECWELIPTECVPHVVFLRR
jgi:hypothetical protein